MTKRITFYQLEAKTIPGSTGRISAGLYEVATLTGVVEPPVGERVDLHWVRSAIQADKIEIVIKAAPAGTILRWERELTLNSNT